MRGEVGWIMARLGDVQRLEVLGQSLDLRHVFQLISVGMGDSWWEE